MNLEKQVRKNQAQIAKLATSMGLWLNTPHAQKTDVRARILELQERTLFRLQELEIEGQTVKIANMEKVLRLLKEGIETPLV